MPMEYRSSGKLYYTALAADQYSVSFQVHAMLIDAFQKDIARMTQDNTTLILVPMTLWCASSQM